MTNIFPAFPYHVCVHCPQRPEVVAHPLRLEFQVVSYKAPCGCWELNQDPLLKQAVILIASLKILKHRQNVDELFFRL